MSALLWFLLGSSLTFNFFMWWRNDDLNKALEAALNEALGREMSEDDKV